jgi:hypothetical protein
MSLRSAHRIQCLDFRVLYAATSQPGPKQLWVSGRCDERHTSVMPLVSSKTLFEQIDIRISGLGLCVFIVILYNSTPSSSCGPYLGPSEVNEPSLAQNSDSFTPIIRATLSYLTFDGQRRCFSLSLLILRYVPPHTARGCIVLCLEVESESMASFSALWPSSASMNSSVGSCSKISPSVVSNNPYACQM